jgi:anti-sigma B factor antagonist
VVNDVHEVVAFVTGEVDAATCGHLQAVIEPHLESSRRLVLDLSGVTFMDSSCLDVLEPAQARLTGSGGSLVLRNLSRIAQRFVSTTGLHKVLAIEIG